MKSTLRIDERLKKDPNYHIFEERVHQVYEDFCHLYGNTIMSMYTILVGNQHDNFHPRPTIGVRNGLDGKYLVIKLSIYDFIHDCSVAVQMAHELTHYVIYTVMGLDKEKADFEEESLCTAMSLMFVKRYNPEFYEFHVDFIKRKYGEKHPYYNGIYVAEEFLYDIPKLAKEIFITYTLKKYREENNSVKRSQM